MATRKSGKTSRKLIGGPYHSRSIMMSPGCATLSFACREYLGHYGSDGRWKSEIVELVVDDNPNFVLGYN